MISIPEDKMIEVMQGVIDDYLKPHFLSLGMNASGTWLNSLQARANGNRGEIWGVDYTEYLVNGRPQNKDQSHEAKVKFAVWAGNTFIKEWVKAKGISANPIAVAYSIADKGTSYYPNGTDLLEILNSPQVKSYVYNAFGQIMTGEIKAFFQRTIKQIYG